MSLVSSILSPPILSLVSSVLSPPISGWCWHVVCLFRSWKYRVALHTNRLKNRLDKDDKKLKLNLSWVGNLKQDLVKVQTMFLRLMGRESRPPSLVKRKNPKPSLVVILVISLASDSIYRVPSRLLRSTVWDGKGSSGVCGVEREREREGRARGWREAMMGSEREGKKVFQLIC
ncbi:hypothetical protein NE237_024558 [Protea cynaroides]|uniref:Uncharacterized protein n=1 Tax=Protea cynaroides TaxID=273540 RepID=A0A9Q0H4G9_9MAGN|nr:hypothetical protein NE237_024558 [Protea cynaroides]